MIKFSKLSKGIIKGSAALIVASSLNIFNGGSLAGASSPNLTGSLSVSPDSILCGKPATVTMNLTGQSGITQNPTDVALILDKSGSMISAMPALKNAANQFIDIMDEESDGIKDGVIGNGSRVGIVRFDYYATTLPPSLTTQVGPLKSSISSLSAGGGTNHEAAFTTAHSLLNSSQPANKKVMIMFTDGHSTHGNRNYNTGHIKTAGTEIYTIGLGDVNTTQLMNWGSDPKDQHVFITPNTSQLVPIFKEIGAAIVTPAATNISIHGKVNNNFTVSNVSATKGQANMTGNDFNWNIDTLNSESASLTYTITHTGTQDGTFNVNDMITYSDQENQSVTFDDATVTVSGCDTEPPVTEVILTNEDGCAKDGWYNKNVTVQFDAQDDKSGVDRTEYKTTFNGQEDEDWTVYDGNSFTYTEEGSYTIKYRSFDKAGNAEEEKTISFNIDKTAPMVNVTLDKTELWPVNHKLVPINASIDATDSQIGSGIKSIELVSITSNEDENGLGDGNTEKDYEDALFGTDDRSFTLRAERSGSGDGRTYTITYKVTDQACNETIKTTTVKVPRDQSKK